MRRAAGELALHARGEVPAAPASVKGRLVVTSSEAGAEMSIDGGPRQALAGAVTLPVGPHHVHVEKAGFEVAERGVEVVNGQDASLLLTLVPTSETEAQLDQSRQTIRTVGWSLVIGGAALVAGGVIFGIVSHAGAASMARRTRSTGSLATDMQETLPNGMPNGCWNHPSSPAHRRQSSSPGAVRGSSTMHRAR